VITVVDNGSSAVWHLREDDAGSPQWRLLDLPPDIGFGGPAIARSKEGRLEVAVTVPDALLHSSQTDPSGGEWHEHRSLGRPADQVMTWVGPALAENKDGRMEAFVLASSQPSEEEGGLWTIRQEAQGGWSPWLELGTPGGHLRHRPAVAANRGGRLEVFAQGDPGTVYVTRQDPTAPDGWSPWAEVRTPEVALTGRPVVTRNKDARLEVFALGADGAVWHAFQKASGDWSAWASLEGQDRSLSGLAAGAHADGRLVVFAVAEPPHGAAPQEPNLIWQREHAPAGGWSPWRSFTRPTGSPAVTDPVLALDASQRLQLWLRVPGSVQLYQLKQTAASGTEWDQRVREFSSPPSTDPAPEPERAGGPRV
jgi:hypothetical protein